MTALYSPASERITTLSCVVGQLGSALGYFAFICDSLAPILNLPRLHVFALTALCEAPLVLISEFCQLFFE